MAQPRSNNLSVEVVAAAKEIIKPLIDNIKKKTKEIIEEFNSFELVKASHSQGRIHRVEEKIRILTDSYLRSLKLAMSKHKGLFCFPPVPTNAKDFLPEEQMLLDLLDKRHKEYASLALGKKFSIKLENIFENINALVESMAMRDEIEKYLQPGVVKNPESEFKVRMFSKSSLPPMPPLPKGLSW